MEGTLLRIIQYNIRKERVKTMIPLLESREVYVKTCTELVI